MVAPARAQTPPSLPEMRPDTRVHFEQGLAQYQARRYDDAIREFRLAYAAEPLRDIAYAWAQAERLRGNCAGAIPLYRRFIADAPTQSEADRAQAHLEQCQRLLPRPWYSDWLGDGLVLAGATGLAIGLVLYADSSSDEESAARAPDYRRYRSLVDDAETARTGATLLLSSGAGLVTAGILRYVFRSQPDRQTAVGLLPGGWGVVVGRRF
jgi:tetratricopeptide (TPR) repeat protein